MPASQLPWAQIPHFVAGETNLEDFAKKLVFLSSTWPEEHIQHLGPRVVLQCDAIAFKKVSQIPTERLKSKEGCKAILDALGVQWGRFKTEDRYLKFERAIYSTQQKTDESNDSYIARHEACFEDLLQKDHEVTLKEIQSYVLIRHSSLSSEEKKRIIVDSNGILKYETTREAIRLLGSRFFQDLQGASRGKLKTYDVHSVEEDHDTSSDNHNAKGDGVYVNEEIDEEKRAARGNEMASMAEDYLAELPEELTAKGHEQTTFPPVASSPEFEAVHFAEEEGSDESILDTGASRTIIGSNRVEPLLLKSLKGMALKKMVPQFQLEELSGEEDLSLTSKASDEKLTYSQPKGIHNLLQWGQETFESGKHKKKAFNEVFQNDPQYVQYILANTRLVANDMRSFQNYCKAMKKKMSQQMVTQGPIPVRKSATSTMSNKTDSEWVPIDVESPMPGTKMLESTPDKKRSLAEPPSTSSMLVEPNYQRAQELRTQMAILQRELDRQEIVNEMALHEDS
ncbi:unnamed protein product [Durusdinium trenchii]|uniref:Uncharacterized protein n=2 Tax=Durusdinium trenchii TaxID=1381693 RepID=A0ABP0KWQ6_9DINO